MLKVLYSKRKYKLFSFELFIFDKIRCGLLTKLLPEEGTPYRTRTVFVATKYLSVATFLSKKETKHIRYIKRTDIIGVITAAEPV